MPDERDLALLKRASNPGEAKVLFAVLTGNGIPAYIDGALLQDEWALSQQVLSGVKIFVPRSRLEEAKQVLEAARSAGEELEGDDAESDAGRET